MDDNSDKIVFKRIVFKFPPSTKKYFVMSKKEIEKIFELAKINEENRYLGPYVKFAKF